MNPVRNFTLLEKSPFTKMGLKKKNKLFRKCLETFQNPSNRVNEITVYDGVHPVKFLPI